MLEPACGDGAFLGAVARRGRAVLGIELDEAAVVSARAAVPSAEVIGADFLDWAVEALDAGREFDAVVGNPPYIRYQYLDAATQTKIERLYARLGLPFTRHTNAWVPFVLAGLRLLRPGGRLAMVVPAELVHVLHAGVARDELIAQCARVAVIEPARPFAGTLQGVLLILAEKGPGPARLVLGDGEIGGAALAGGKWTVGWLTGDERALLGRMRVSGRAVRFADVADVAVGIVTGANHFFLVPDDVVAAYGLGDHARPMFGRSDHVAGAIYEEADHAGNRARGVPTNFLHFGNVPRNGLAAGPLRYIERGEAEGLHRRFKCRIRDPWWAVPSVHASPVGMLKRCHDFPRLVLNRLGAYTTDTAYRVAPRGWSEERMVAGFVNSLTALSAELEGRSYGGGVLELVPSEIGKLLLPSAERGDVEALDRMLRRGMPAEELLPARDAECLGGDSAERALLHGAWLRLRARRQRRG